MLRRDCGSIGAQVMTERMTGTYARRRTDFAYWHHRSFLSHSGTRPEVQEKPQWPCWGIIAPHGQVRKPTAAEIFCGIAFCLIGAFLNYTPQAAVIACLIAQSCGQNAHGMCPIEKQPDAS